LKITRIAGSLAVGVLLVLPASPVLAQEATLKVTGSGAQEVPGPGEEGSTVTGQFTFDEAAGTITYTVSVAGNAEPAAAAHLHEAPAGKAGDVVVTLDAAAVNAGSQASVKAAPELVAQIAANPADFYLNVHSPSFPKGFTRAQLAGSAASESAPTSVPAGDGSSSGSSMLIGTVLLASGAAVAAAGLARRRRSGTY
jgi:hypothetical protein